jgi:hypothetical protein
MSTELDPATVDEINDALAPVAERKQEPGSPPLCNTWRAGGRRCPTLARWLVQWVCSECGARPKGLPFCETCAADLKAGKVTHRGCRVEPAGTCVHISRARIRKRWWR